MKMARSNRSAELDREDRDFGRAAPGSLPIRIAETIMRNPVTAGGIAVSLAMVVVTVANALANQPGRHPRPLFETRALSRGETHPAAAPSPTSTPSPVPAVLPRPRPVSGLDETLVRDLQVTLAEHGFYAGSIDGVVGPATAEAIKAAERRLGVTPTGEASELLLAALRAAPTIAARPVSPQPAKQTVTTRPAPAAKTTSVPDDTPLIPAQAPTTPSMRVATADAIAYPASREEMADYAEADTPVFTGSIRRAAREPLAAGGDEKLQKLQRALVAAGYGPLKADGRWDERSVSAVRRYEADRGWPVTGKPTDRLVWDLMAKSAQRR